MTNEEAISVLKGMKHALKERDFRAEHEAINMAIEALSAPIVAKHFDIQSDYIYCSPQIAENVKVVVRCKDCRYRGKEEYPVCCENADDWYCASGERREP